MARSKINDYVLEIGWDGRQANAGLSQLEKRINKLAKASERLNKSASKNSNVLGKSSSRSGGILGKDIIEDRKLTMLKLADDKVRSLKKSMMNLDMGAKGAKQARAQFEANIRSVEAYKASLKGMTITTRSQLRKQRQSWISLNSAIEDSRLKILHANKSLGFLKSTMRGAIKSFGTAAVAAVGAYAAIGAVKALYTSAKAWENLTIQMQASFGSAEAGQERMQFLIDKARTLGVDVTSLADGYAKIGVAARMSGVPVADSEEIFLAAAESSRAFGLSMDDTQGVMRAFSQMMGKGQVMMEELKLQLGDRMPSAMGIFAKSMGKTMPEFIELVKSGSVGNKELANFARYLRKDIRESGAFEKSLDSLEASQTRFNTALQFAGTAFMGGEMNEAFKDMFLFMTDFFEETKGFWSLLGDILGTVLKFGFRLLRVVILPIQKSLGVIGDFWKYITETSLIDSSDLDKLEGIKKLMRVITGLWFDIKFIASFVFDWIVWAADRAVSKIKEIFSFGLGSSGGTADDPRSKRAKREAAKRSEDGSFGGFNDFMGLFFKQAGSNFSRSGQIISENMQASKSSPKENFSRNRGSRSSSGGVDNSVSVGQITVINEAGDTVEVLSQKITEALPTRRVR